MKPLACLALLALAPLGEQATPADPAPAASSKVSTFLMFEGGRAEEAMRLYVSLFEGSKVEDLELYGPGDPLGKEGTVKHAVFSLAGRDYHCIDSSFDHPFTFTPSVSLFVTCESEAEIDELFAELSVDGEVMMPLQAYPFARKFVWLSDRFGVSWQLILPNE